MFSTVNNETQHGDTLTKSDLVTRQYESLPYPRISEQHIKDEENYYKNPDETMMIWTPSNNLENINHYLHQGDQSFRYVQRDETLF